MKIFWLRIFVCGMALTVSSMGWCEKVAVLKLNSNYACTIVQTALFQSLAGHGYTDGDGIQVDEYDAGGSVDTLATLAGQIAGGDYDLILSLSTPALQAAANANTETKVPHVFSFVTSAYIADVGVSKDGTKPSYLTGISNPNPVKEAFRLAREMQPALNKVGLVWNAAEANSVFQTELAREICAELGIELLEETVPSSDEVIASVQKLIDLGVEALYCNGESTVRYVIDRVTALAAANGIPVFTVGSGGVEEGTLFDLGPDYEKVGTAAGDMAAEILMGANPADIPAVDFVTETLYLNLNALQGLNETWTISQEEINRAELVIGLSDAARWGLYR